MVATDNFNIAWLNPAHVLVPQDQFDHTQIIEGTPKVLWPKPSVASVLHLPSVIVTRDYCKCPRKGTCGLVVLDM